MKPFSQITRRIGPHPHANGTESSGAKGCPDLFELDSGDFAVIGIDQTEELRPLLPSDAACGPDERIVIVDRHVFTRARQEIPVK